MNKIEHDFLIPKNFMNKFLGAIFEEVCFQFLQEKYKNGWWINIQKGSDNTTYGFIFDNNGEINAWDDFRYMHRNGLNKKEQLQISLNLLSFLLESQKSKIDIKELSQSTKVPEYGYESCYNSLYNLNKLQWHHELFGDTGKIKNLKENEKITIIQERRLFKTATQDTKSLKETVEKQNNFGAQTKVKKICSDYIITEEEWILSKSFLKKWKSRILTCFNNFEKFNNIYNKWEEIEKNIVGVPDCIIFLRDKIIIYEFKFGVHQHALTQSQKINLKNGNFEYRVLNAKYDMPQKVKINEFTK